MSRLRAVVIVFVVLMASAIGWIGYRLVYVWQHIPEAYAAWDAGTLLVEYMNSNENKWPSSWDDLLRILETDAGKAIPLRGRNPDELNYAGFLKQYVAINWTFNPTSGAVSNPVTRVDGKQFPVVWEGAEPN